MNKKRDTYDRITVGKRIHQKRIQLGLSQDELAVRINRATKYCSDIERGMCGMSIETMLSISKALDMSLDYMMFGEISEVDPEHIIIYGNSSLNVMFDTVARSFTHGVMGNTP